METIDEILNDFRGILNDAQRDNIKRRIERSLVGKSPAAWTATLPLKVPKLPVARPRAIQD